MKSIIPILTLGVVFAASGAAAKPMGHGSNIILSAPPVATLTPVPTVNPGAISPVTPTTIDMQQNFGALPGEPGSATYDPNAALPSLGNEGSSLAPTPGTSAAGFNTPSVSSVLRHGRLEPIAPINGP